MDIFLSYSSKDRDRVTRIVSALESNGYSVWWDTRIDLGTSFDKKIEAELDTARCVVVVWSKDSVESEWVLNEASEGLDRKILVPVRIDDVRIPLAFRRLQTADLTEITAESLGKVLDGVSNVLTNDGAQSDKSVSKIERGRRFSRSLMIGSTVIASIVAVAVWWNAPGKEFGGAYPQQAQNRVAVLPFQDLSPDGGLQWLADGLQIRLTQVIGSSAKHQVIPTPLASRLLDAGKTADIDLLISGTLQQQQDTVHTTIEVTELSTKRQLWSQTFTGRSMDLFDYQKSMALQVARYFSTTVDNESVPSEPAAWNPYLKYLHFQWGGAFDKEMYWLERTLELDSGWTDGWMSLATQLIRRAAVLKEERWIEQAKHAAEMACETSSVNDPRCKISMADYAIWIDGDLEWAEQALRSVMIQDGLSFSYALLMLTSGLPTQALEMFERLTDTAPLLPIVWDWLSYSRGISGDLVGALEAANEFGRLLPGNSVVPDVGSGVIAAKLGMTDQAIELSHRLGEASGEAVRGSDYARFTTFGSELIEAKVSTVSEDYSRAGEIANQFVQIEALDFAAAVYLEIGDDRAGDLLKKAAENPQFYRRGISLFLLYLDRDLHGNPDVQEYLKALGLTEEWKQELCSRAQDTLASLDARCET